MSAADEALRVLLVKAELLDERAAGHVYRQSIAAGKTLDLFLLDEKILEPEDVVRVVEEREKHAHACPRPNCPHVTYLLPGQSAATLLCLRCKTPLSGERSASQRARISSMAVVTRRRSKTPALIGGLVFLCAAGALGYAYQQKQKQKQKAETPQVPADPGAEAVSGAEGDQAELEVLVQQVVEASAEGKWGLYFDCFAERLQSDMALANVTRAREAVSKNGALEAEWKDICGDHYWLRSLSESEQDLGLKVWTKLSANERRQLYVDTQKLLGVAPDPGAKAELTGLRIADSTAHGTISADGVDERKAEFVLENEEWRVRRLWN